MAKATIMYAMIMDQLSRIEKDCVKFDEKQNVQAGIRVRTRLRKVRKKIKLMIDDMQETSHNITHSRGKLTTRDYYHILKKQGYWKKYNAKKRKDKELQESQEK